MLKVTSIIFAIIAVLFFTITIFSTPRLYLEAVERTIENNRRIETVLLSGANFVEDFRKANKVLPTSKEYDEWASKQRSIDPYSVKYSFIETNPADIVFRLNDSYVQKTGFGTPTDSSFLIGMWRGEWHEFYVSWTQTTTLTFNTADYFLLGTAINEFLLFLFLFLITACVSILLWKKSADKKTTLN